ncbi:aftiphilin a isoform X2 [Limanda limanda]|uniref:aftiphilin a isoform X2 n=1 Tax=Limanda limanda TaxID=27771 RepID=UPI0029C6E77E|nr:aftiphilin a isoform X2 [Limanda limanda]
MEPDVIRMYSSSPPPMEDGAEEEEDEFGDFGTFSAVPNSISFTEFDTPTTFNQTQALDATSPPELSNSRGAKVFGSSNATTERPTANGVPASHPGACPSERTETRKVPSCSPDASGSRTVGGELADCNGEGSAVLTNGFGVQGSPSSQSSVLSHVRGTSTEDTGNVLVSSPADDFADFAAFSDAEEFSQTTNKDTNSPSGVSWVGDMSCHAQHCDTEQGTRPEDQHCDAEQGTRPEDQHCDTEQGTRPEDQHCDTEQGTRPEDTLRDTNRTEPNVSGPESRPAPAEALDRSSHTDSDQESSASDDEAVSLNTVDVVVDVVVDGDESEDAAGCNGNDLSPEAPADSEEGQSDEKGSWNETETETSFGRPLSTDALEDYADISTTGSVPSPPLQGEPSTPADHSQLVEDDEDFGDFGDADSFGAQGFADFEELDVEQEQSTPPSSAPAQEVTNTSEDNDFGDFNSPGVLGSGNERQDEGQFEDFPVSDSFGNFSSAVENADGEVDAGWSAFGEQEQPVEGEESWAAFSSEQSVALPAESREEDEVMEEEWHEGDAGGEETSSTGSQAASLSTRLLTLFQSSFPHSTGAALVEEEVASLRILLEPPEDKQPGDEETRSACNRWVQGGVWTQLQDINEALGLRYQWGGSHGNKVLLCCLGIDTRNILFTGQKKQPVIVPMYAASLGMLEPTKEPVKPVSAAEMITSIAQASPLAPERSSCPSDAVQDALPPVQFDWSSSGLTNPLDASGGSSLLNLDFFGPVEDSGSDSSTSIPGVDPELYELTTAKMDAGSSGSRMADAFARLMSTMEKTSTSTRKPRRDENLSEEAAKVISFLPDLSFMTAKVLMFPATLTPLDSRAASD